MSFSYDEFTTRNLGFITAQDQQVLKKSSVFISGVGGMGGACIQSLVRAGVSNFIIADMDVFEVSNLNRQVFATMKTVGIEKAEATKSAVFDINPEAKVEVYGREWLDRMDEILSRVHIVVNGMDDISASIRLYRAARKAGLTIVDAYAASLPSVYVTRPGDKTPEERLDYPTKGREPEEWGPEDIATSFMHEMEYVMGLSSSRHYIDLEMGAEMAAGKRKRMSYAPMVIVTGNLMAYEVLNRLLDKKGGADNRGYFFNPYTCKTEKPPIAIFEVILRRIARRAIAKLLATA